MALRTWHNSLQHAVPHAPARRAQSQLLFVELLVPSVRQFGVTNWNWVSANIDQGIFWWLYNLTEHGPARVLHRPHGPNGTRDAAGHSAWWVHMQGYCKPWLAGTPAFGKNPRCGNMLKDLLQSFWVAPRRETTLTQCSIAGLVAER